MASGKWQVASGKWQKIAQLQYVVKLKLKINDGCHPVGSFAPAQDLVRNNEILCSRFTPHRMTAAFTLIELSIVLVIIGLVIGGVLVGQDLINAAAIRAQISQIEKYNTAVHTFQVKYGYLPGDIPDPTASAFGFKARGSNRGQGDGNGILEGLDAYISGTAYCGVYTLVGENVLFWVDLSQANLITPQLTLATASFNPSWHTSDIPKILPTAAIGNGNYVSVGNGGCISHPVQSVIDTTENYFNISAITTNGLNNVAIANPTITVNQAYSIDSKIDDGLPESGNVTARYFTTNGTGSILIWVGGWATKYTTPTPALPRQVVLITITELIQYNNIP